MHLKKTFSINIPKYVRVIASTQEEDAYIEYIFKIQKMCRKSVHHYYSTHCARHTHTHTRLKILAYAPMGTQFDARHDKSNQHFLWMISSRRSRGKELDIVPRMPPSPCHCARSCEWNEIEQVFLIRRHSHFYITPRSATTTKEQLYSKCGASTHYAMRLLYCSAYMMLWLTFDYY